MDIAHASEARLHIVTIGPAAPVQPCDGTYTCGCEPCAIHRADLVARGVRPLQPQPYKSQRRPVAA
jgi:hypothetical protein